MGHFSNKFIIKVNVTCSILLLHLTKTGKITNAACISFQLNGTIKAVVWSDLRQSFSKWGLTSVNGNVEHNKPIFEINREIITV